MPGHYGYHKCTLCKQIKPVSEFRSYINKYGKVTYHYRCNACIEAQKKKLANSKKITPKEQVSQENQQELQRLICKGFRE